MKWLVVLISIFSLIFGVDFNSSDVNKSEDNNLTTDSNVSEAQKNIQKQLDKEAKYKKEQKFYLGDDYNLSEHKVDKNSLKHIQAIEPDYDFDMDDVYSDE